MSRSAAEALLEQVREERRKRTEARCRASLYAFFVESFGVLESTKLDQTPWIKAQCDSVQAWLEGWLVAQGCDKDGKPLKATPEMVARQEAHWRRELAGLPDAEELLATQPWFREPLVQDLVINGYPGSLKSRIVMVVALAWMWLHDPTFTMAATSGTSNNVARDSNMCKELVRSPWYRETFRIEWTVGANRAGAVVDAQEEWANSAGGYRLSKELFSSWQGVHADMLGVDDPDDAHKVWGEAERKRTREKVVALRNRIRVPLQSLRVIVQQRVHAEDVTWHTMSGGAWSGAHRKRPAILSIPLQYRAARSMPTPWGWRDPRTLEDEVSHPARYTAEFVAAERVAYTAAGFEAQYNQNPSAGVGGWFKRENWHFWRPAGALEMLGARPRGCVDRVVRPTLELKLNARGFLDLDYTDLSVDASFGSLSDAASGVSLTLIGGRGGQRFVLYDSTKPRTYTETEDAIRDIVKSWRMTRISKLLIESKAQGTAVMDRLRKAMAGVDSAIPRLLGPDGKPTTIPIEMLEPDGGKAARAHAALPVQESGLVYVLDGADWLDEWMDEVSAFPFGRRDDRVDTLSQALNYRAGHAGGAEQARREVSALAALSRLSGLG